MTAEPTDEQHLADVRADLAGARPVVAAGPGPGATALRRAYLDLLKLSVCDLAGISTSSVGALDDGRVMSRELRGDAVRLRSAGMDWPLQGLTMIGLRRLDDLQACVEQVVADAVAGDVIEAGAWRGGASLVARATLTSLGDTRIVCVADSFQGFPADADDADARRLSAFDYLAAPLDEVRSSFARHGLEQGVEFIGGFFEETLPALAGRQWSIIRLDGDSYEATRLALTCLYPGLAVGGHVILDDYGSFEGCRRAADEFRVAHGIEDPLVKVDATGARWRRSTAGGVECGVPEPRTVRAVVRSGQREVPTARELALTDELAAARAALSAATAHRERRGPAAWSDPRTWWRSRRHAR
jgi:O-methyltransferase